MFKRVLFLILSLAVLVGMGLATSAAFAANGVWGQERWRWEGWNNVPAWDFDEVDSPPAKDVDDSFGYSFLRSRIGYSTDIGEHGIFNIAVENTRIFGLDGFGDFPDSEPDSWFNEDVILHEAYLGLADFVVKGLDVYAGRFGNLAYGRERILGPEDWSFYYKNRFDGFKSHYMFEKGWFDLLCLKLNETLMDKYNPPGEGESFGRGDTDLRGAYAHFDPMDGLYVEPYVLWASMDNYYKDPSVSNDNFFVCGALVDYMSDMGLHIYGEGVIESGKTHTLDTVDGVLKQVDDWKYSAFGAYVGAFYEADMTSRPFIGAEFNYASGTDESDAFPDDPDQVRKWKTFRSPFGSFSTYMGIMNMVDWANTASLRFSAGLTPIEKTDVKLDVYLFRLANDEDYAYGGYSLWNQPRFGDIGSDFVPTLPGDFESDDNGISHANKTVGTEFDLMINHQIEENVTLQGGVSMFKYGDYFGKNSVDGEDQDWANTLYGWIGAQVQF